MRSIFLLAALSLVGALLAGCGGAADDPDTEARSAGRSYAFMQGNIIYTGNSLDVAVNGRGLLMFRDGAGREVYSRNGALRIDRDGTIVAVSGQRLLGRVWDESLERTVGDFVPAQVQVRDGGYPVATGQGPNKALQGVRLSMNLDAGADIIPASVPRIRFDDPNTYNFSTTQTVYDAQGGRLTMAYYFQKYDINRWRVYASINGAPLDQANGQPYDSSASDPDPLLDLVFDASGRLAPASSTREAVVMVNDPRVPASAPVLFPALKVRAVDVVQFMARFAISELRQDGYAWGQLSGIGLDAEGFVIASYSNGQIRRLYQLHLAEFTNPAGLADAGSGFWVGSAKAGDKVTQPPGSGSAGVLQSGALEEAFVTRPPVLAGASRPCPVGAAAGGGCR